MSSAAPAKAAFDLKSTTWTLTALRLQTARLDELVKALDARFGATPGMFDNDPVVIDLSPLRDADPVLDFAALLPHIRRHRLLPIAVQGGSLVQTTMALEAGLVAALDAAPAVDTGRRVANPALNAPTVHQAIEVREVVREMVREVPAEGAAPTMVIDKPLRSGQRVYARGGDLVVMAAVSVGAEVIADGSIHVYAPLRGRAIAGARGNHDARIFSLCMQPQLVSIAGIYRTTETELPAHVLSKPAQVRLDGERILIEPLDG